MPNPIVAGPDDEAAIIQYLCGLTQVTALVPASRISSESPPSPTTPYVLVKRVGGLIIRPAIDETALQIDAVGGTKQQCKTIMLMLRAAILAIANDVVAGVVLSSATEEVGPSWLPDTVPVPPIPRYTARYRVLLHN